jgi:predicted DNA-binding transcriptional regulator AlpA
MTFLAQVPRLTVTIKEARQMSGLSHSQIYVALNAGLLESRKVLGRRLVVYSSLERLLLSRADDRPPSAFTENPRGDGQLRRAR